MRKRSNDPLAPRAPAKARARPRQRDSDDTALPSQDDSGHVPERTCILTRRAAPKEALVRLALSPDGEVAPDVRARAPGRGAWIGVNRAELDAANAKGRLKGALVRAFRTADIRVAPDLGERIESALRRSALDRLGMEAKSGNLINGSDRIETAARAGQVRLLLFAADAGADGRRRLDQAWRVGGGGPHGLEFPATRTILSLALGRENVVHVALTDPAAAARVQDAVLRWRAFIDPDAGLDGGDPAGLATGSADAE